MTDEFIAGWIDTLLDGRGAPPAMARVLEVLRTAPQEAAFATVKAMAAAAHVNIATVTRTAQFLGFTGWPAFIIEYRGHYLAGLRADSMLAPAGEVGASGPREVVLGDISTLQGMAEGLDEDAYSRAAARIRSARRTVVLATGTYLAPAEVLAHNGQLLGYDLELPHGPSSAQLNAVRKLGEGDVVIAFTVWKTAEIVLRLARFARERGAALVVFADRSTEAARLAEVVVTVPSESSRYLPSTIPAVAAVQAVLTVLADLDREHVEAHLREADELWRSMGIVEP
ncbi:MULTISPECIES: MurR/RpiR family transcriptional regulator [Brevibacterium]|jgi:RpiR family carbohydrate utilization transcriptional regulator|uniref:SIS domain-containing protein n=1 Tax=Brevibacterium salitolerans TaxID=1403566 RepID=A0ABP5IE40_9MICO|nr:hypothetical protein [Brevibacterium sp.]